VIAPAPKLICYPPAPLNGGPLEHAPAKVGEWSWQPKVDDWRGVIHTPTRTIWNQYGQLSSFTQTDKFTVALDRLATVSFAAEWLDVGLMENRHDLMRGCIIVLDLIEAGLVHWQRRARLSAIFPTLPFDLSRLLAETRGQVRDSVYLVSEWTNVENHTDALKREAWLRTENEIIGHKFYEGLVAKVRSSLYQFGTRPKRQCATWIKHRFDQ
jgi:hypothetical protein